MPTLVNKGAGEGDRRRNVPRVPPTPPAPSLLITNGCRKGSREEEEEEDEAKSQESPLHILLCRNKEAEERFVVPMEAAEIPGWELERVGFRTRACHPSFSFLSFSLSGRVPLSGETTGSIPKQGEEEEEEEAAGAAPPPLLSASPPSPEDTDGYERLIYGKDKALLGTGDAVPQAFQQRPRLLSTI